MSRYVDGYVIPIKKSNLKSYKKMAAKGCKLWMEHGAVVFAYFVYKSKAHRNQVNAKVMKDPRMKMDVNMPFDMKRFSMGGFKTMVYAK